MTTETEPIDGILRRTVLKASAAAAGALTLSGTTAADEDDEEDDYDENDDEVEVDEPDGFDVEVIAEHAPFADEVAATFEVTYDDADEPITVDLDDASTVILAEATWEEGAESGWHRHPGMSIVRMIEGEIEHTMEDDCVPRTYSAGDAWIDPGHVHKADSEEGALAHVTFLGIPDGEPATEWVEPVEC
ncbi:cupin domain-containing protein [Halobacteria archaeon AArc-m2/3/4]|uniref:Cupin domain-containing protein n=1 Tax=Natronoglomus mannanivorans TaxID=2979990 RepID=A0ABT2QAX0_9EURY|nr:cupin domain-containing protein [Halobacteria archaeon AArc-m2/3/4]